MHSDDDAHRLATTHELSSEAREKLELAQCFIRSYTASRQGLARLGILRSERDVQGDYAEWFVAELMGLQLAASGVQKGYDALDNDGRRYQVKARKVTDLRATTSFDFRAIDLERPEFEFLVGVFFSPSLDVLGVIKAPFEAVCAHLSTNTNGKRFRWNSVTARDIRIEKVLWPAESESGDALDVFEETT